MQKYANHGGARQISGAKPPLQRRDNSIYDADTWKEIGIKRV
jgi:hypothetical protein